VESHSTTSFFHTTHSSARLAFEQTAKTMPRKDAASEPSDSQLPTSAAMNAPSDAAVNEPDAAAASARDPTPSAAAAAAATTAPPAYHQRRYDSDDEEKAAADSGPDHTLVFGAMLAALWGALSGLYHFFLHALKAMRRDRAATASWAEFVEVHGARLVVPLLACIVCTLLVRAFWRCLVPSRDSRRGAAKKAVADKDAAALASKKAH
jgi:hypothetical protein